MRSAQSTLKVLVPAALALIAVEAVVSIAAGWPHRFNGHGRPDQVLADFVGSGTALSPPLWLVVLLAVCWAGLRARSPWRGIALVLLVPVTALLTMGSIGEAVAPATSDVPRAVQLVGGVVDVLVSLALLLLTVVSLVQARRAGAQAQPAQ